MYYKVFLWFATFSCNNFEHVLICSSHLMEQFNILNLLSSMNLRRCYKSYRGWARGLFAALCVNWKVQAFCELLLELTWYWWGTMGLGAVVPGFQIAHPRKKVVIIKLDFKLLIFWCWAKTADLAFCYFTYCFDYFQH